MRYLSVQAICVGSDCAWCLRAPAAEGWGVGRGGGVASSCDATASLRKPGELLSLGLTESQWNDLSNLFVLCCPVWSSTCQLMVTSAWIQCSRLTFLPLPHKQKSQECSSLRTPLRGRGPWHNAVHFYWVERLNGGGSKIHKRETSPSFPHRVLLAGKKRKPVRKVYCKYLQGCSWPTLTHLIFITSLRGDSLPLLKR